MKHSIQVQTAAALSMATFTVAVAACGDNQTHPVHDLYTPGDPQPLPCLPNLDGKIVASEMKPVIGASTSYLIPPMGTTRDINIVGAVDGSGHHTWDWSVDLADDQVVHIAASKIDDKWYAASFPDAGFVTPFDAADTTDAIYKIDDSALWLLGLASVDPHPSNGQTLLVYMSPVALFQFPIAPGASWKSVGEVRSSMLHGLPYAGRDTYDVRVDAAGTIALPDLSFTQAHRVRTTVTVEPAAGITSTQKQVSFLFECFGEVARATSKLNEPNDDFTTAAEVRRLGLGEG
jgi:hypothetical protein